MMLVITSRTSIQMINPTKEDHTKATLSPKNSKLWNSIPKVRCLSLKSAGLYTSPAKTSSVGLLKESRGSEEEDAERRTLA